MQVWAPEVNTVSKHAQISKNLGDRNYWNLYFAEPDLRLRDQLLYQETPKPEKRMRLLEDVDEDDSNTYAMVNESNSTFASSISEDEEESSNGVWDDHRNLAAKPVEDKRSRGFNIDIIVEVKLDPENPRTSVLTYDHFKEVARFE